MFSDESHFQLTFGNQHYRCRRSRESDKFDPKFARKCVKHASKLMVWGCFSWKGRGGLEFLRPTTHYLKKMFFLDVKYVCLYDFF
jgi:hypothetical protein